MEHEATGGAEWGDWLMGVGDKLLGAAIDAKVANPQKIRELEIQRLGTLGYYSEGRAGIGQAFAGIPPAILLAGAAVAVYLLVKG